MLFSPLGLLSNLARALREGGVGDSLHLHHLYQRSVFRGENSLEKHCLLVAEAGLEGVKGTRIGAKMTVQCQIQLIVFFDV